jgi:hypothetical protein
MSITLDCYLFHVIIEDALGSAIVSLNRGGWLGMSHGREGCLLRAGFLDVVEAHSNFGICHGCQYVFHY